MATEIRPMRTDYSRTTLIVPGKFSNARELVGYQTRDGRGGNPLHPAGGNDLFEEVLAQNHRALRLRVRQSGMGED